MPEKISEEYYQISEEILSSFSKYRPPVDLFRFRDDIAQHVSRQPAIGSLQTVRNPIIEMRIGRETVHNLVKTTGDHADLPIMRVKRVNQFKRAMREMHAMVDLIENRGRQTLQ